jgi:hypothetical protein
MSLGGMIVPWGLPLTRSKQRAATSKMGSASWSKAANSAEFKKISFASIWTAHTPVASPVGSGIPPLIAKLADQGLQRTLRRDSGAH